MILESLPGIKALDRVLASAKEAEAAEKARTESFGGGVDVADLHREMRATYAKWLRDGFPLIDVDRLTGVE